MENFSLNTALEHATQKYRSDWQGKKVAVVEDKELEQDLLTAMINQIAGEGNVEISCFRGASPLIDKLKAGESEYDLVILDGEIVGAVNGPEALQEILKISPNTRTVGRTGRQDYLGEFESYGADMVFFKNYRDKTAFVNDMTQLASIFEKEE